jgi:hypothetical protein
MPTPSSTTRFALFLKPARLLQLQSNAPLNS